MGHMSSLERLPEPQKLSRRDFLKLGAFSLAGAALWGPPSPEEPEPQPIMAKIRQPDIIYLNQGEGPPDDWEILEPGSFIAFEEGDYLLPDPKVLIDLLFEKYAQYPEEVKVVLDFFQETKEKGLFPINVLWAELRQEKKFGGFVVHQSNEETFDPSDFKAIWVGINPKGWAPLELRSEWPNFNGSNKQLWYAFYATGLAHELTHVRQIIEWSQSCCSPSGCVDWNKFVSEPEAHWIEAQVSSVLLGEGKKPPLKIIIIDENIMADLFRQGRDWHDPLWQTAVEIIRSGDLNHLREKYATDEDFKRDVEAIAKKGWLNPVVYRIIQGGELLILKELAREPTYWSPLLMRLLRDPKFWGSMCVTSFLIRLVEKGWEKRKTSRKKKGESQSVQSG